jgi:type I restriction enzyme, S subunit
MKKGWERKTIGDVCEFQRGLTYAKKDEVDISDNVVLRATNIDLTTNLLTFDELKYISDKVLVPDSKKVKRGSLMICTASGSKRHLGKVAFIDDDYDYAFGGFMGMLTPLNELLPKYLFHLMTSEDYKDFIGTLSDGVNINNLKFDDLRRFPIPVPPLAEQRRIVGILDEAFAGLATAQAHAEKNLQNARALFESHLNNVFSKKGEGWVERRLGEVCEIKGRIGFRGYTRQDLVEEGEGAITLSPSNIRNNQFNTDQCTYISWFKYEESPEIMVFEGDILFVKTGSTYGKVALVDKLPELATINPQFVVLKQIKCDNRFLYYSLTTTSFRAQVERIVGGAATPTLSQANLAEQSVPNPPLQEQIRIAARLDALSAETRRLAAVYERKLAALGALKKSLLHRAFAGEL